jgi:hypothetical protein
LVIYQKTKQGAKAMTQVRAKRGGEVGPNGEFYKGGAFIATTPDYPKGKAKPKGKIRKQEIAPYKWEYAPTPTAESIMRCIEPFVNWTDWRQTGQLTILTHDWGEAGKINRDELERLVKMFNDGERWIDF